MNDVIDQYSDSMRCPITDLVIPKRVKDNIKWRRELRVHAAKDVVFRGILKKACSESILFWLNAFGWTFLQRKVDLDGKERRIKPSEAHVPFITWKVQDEAILQISDAIEKSQNLLINKSREMGASWICLSVFHWFWQFQSSQTFLEMSRKADLVDVKGNMDSLFEKHRYLLRMQPAWLQPSDMRDNVMILENRKLRSVITGESTSENAGQGGRKIAALLDEFTRMPNAEMIDLSLSDTVGAKIYNSTPQGPNTRFRRLLVDGRTRVVELPWWRHPDKGRRAKLIPANGTQVGYTVKPGFMWTSPYYRAQIEIRSPSDVAQNLDMCHTRSGNMFFDAAVIDKHRQAYQMAPMFTGFLSYMIEDEQDEEARFACLRTNYTDGVTFSRTGIHHPWSLWCPLVEGRPSQAYRYSIGVDIAAGTGASNSIITVYCVDNCRIVAKFTSAKTGPYELAEEACKAGIWFGGMTSRPILNWEINGGVGAQFTTQLKKIGYTPLYTRRDITKRGQPKTEKQGWMSTPVQKEDLLGHYRNALASGKVINPCEKSLDEMLTYIYDDKNRLVPGILGTDVDSGALSTHGDHVVADALAYLASEDSRAFKKLEPRMVKNSYAWFRHLHQQSVASSSAWS